jgi:formylglycine-generating enzyme required for sulfatase activity
MKPANILRQPDGMIKVIDFGLSKQCNAVGYTTAYSPLEYSYSSGLLRDFSPTSNIYSLAATLYFLLIVQTPPDACEICEDGLPTFPAEWSEQVKACITQSMQPRRKDRPQSIAAFMALLSGAKVVREEAKLLPEVETNSFVGNVLDVYNAEPPQPVKLEMVFVEGGTFMMESSAWGACLSKDKRHEVQVSNFHISKYEVTQGQWIAVMGSSPSSFMKGDNYPVERVSWKDIQKFLRRLNAATGKQYRLPTEAEWEYAARGGNRSQGYLYSGSNDIGEVAWYAGNSGNKTHPVGQNRPNELGLYDMSGNVWEWCNDRWEHYPTGVLMNPKGATTGSNRVIRGGGWNFTAETCRVAFRSNFPPDLRSYDLGFRVVLP